MREQNKISSVYPEADINKECCPYPDHPPYDAFGCAITDVHIYTNGIIVAGNGEYGSQVNFCPFCGRKADKQIGEK